MRGLDRGRAPSGDGDVLANHRFVTEGRAWTAAQVRNDGKAVAHLPEVRRQVWRRTLYQTAAFAIDQQHGAENARHNLLDRLGQSVQNVFEGRAAGNEFQHVPLLFQNLRGAFEFLPPLLSVRQLPAGPPKSDGQADAAQSTPQRASLP